MVASGTGAEEIGSDPDRVVRQIDHRLVTVAAAEALWRSGVIDPAHHDTSELAERSRVAITKCIHDGLGWPAWKVTNTKSPNYDRELRAYEGNLDFAWCGAFVAWCLSQAGLDRTVRKRDLASTVRLYNWAHGTNRWISPTDARPGDILLIGSIRGPGWGSHIALAVENAGKELIATIEGNAHGRSPDGKIIEGVVKQVRKLSGDYRVLACVRPLESDYER